MIAPITGKLRKRFWLDITMALGLGTSAGYAFWSVFLSLFLRASSVLTFFQTGTASTSRAVSLPFLSQIAFHPEPHIPMLPTRVLWPLTRASRILVQRQEEFYLKLERAKQQE